MADPIAEQWVKAVVSELDTIAAPDYFHTVKPTRRAYKEVTALDKTELPLLQMGLLTLVQDQDVWPLITVQAQQEVVLSVSNTDDAYTQLQRLKSDVEKCIRGNPTLNGLCLNMHVTQADLNAKTDTGGTLEGRVSIESTFWHKEDDPTQGR